MAKTLAREDPYSTASYKHKKPRKGRKTKPKNTRRKPYRGQGKV